MSAFYNGSGAAMGWLTSATSQATTAGFAVQAAVYEKNRQIRYCTGYKWY
ncbi:hypothetical protein [Streptomyces xanthii]|uniref:Nidogen G2 beta-barrel domain-containing protein n=1 Tax=Streptomyces xanthii TaxID=2768069 RepID=A0A7H1BHZ8_9ACTN|nr:hypothetical protein [Streptomyces xanthii]QNS08353.1 hypothetical protein IAG42_35345 [Streptomyces xanthii]